MHFVRAGIFRRGQLRQSPPDGDTGTVGQLKFNRGVALHLNLSSRFRPSLSWAELLPLFHHSAFVLEFDRGAYRPL